MGTGSSSENHSRKRKRKGNYDEEEQGHKRKRRRIVIEDEDNQIVYQPSTKLKEENAFEKIKNTPLTLKGVIEFLKNGMELEEKFIHINAFDLKFRTSKPARIYYDSLGAEIGFFCSIPKIFVSHLNAGYENPIPSIKKMNSFEDVFAYARVFKLSKKNKVDTSNMDEFIVSNEEDEDDHNTLEQEEKTIKTMNEFSKRYFDSRGVFYLLKRLKIEQRFICFTYKDTNNYPNIYFDDRGVEIGFFCNFQRVKYSQMKEGIKTEKQIPRKRLQSYIEVIDWIEYLNTRMKVWDRRNEEEEEGEYQDNYENEIESELDQLHINKEKVDEDEIVDKKYTLRNRKELKRKKIERKENNNDWTEREIDWMERGEEEIEREQKRTREMKLDIQVNRSIEDLNLQKAIELSLKSNPNFQNKKEEEEEEEHIEEEMRKMQKEHQKRIEEKKKEREEEGGGEGHEMYEYVLPEEEEGEFEEEIDLDSID